MRKIKFIIAVLSISIFLVSCEGSRPESLLLVTVDGLTPGDLAELGYLTDSAAVFDNAYTPCPVTLPAITTIMTGLHPLTHGVEGAEFWTLNETAVTMAEMFQTQERRTTSVIGAGDLGEETGLGQGFDTYRYDFEVLPAGPFGYTPYLPADTVTEKASRWLKIFGDKPYFLWVHYGDLASGWTETLSKKEHGTRMAGLAESIKKLLGSLPDEGKSTIVILTSPAADAMGAHGERGHGTLLYNSTLLVPLVIKGPTIKARRIDAPVSLLDILGTTASLFNFEIPMGVQGMDLAPLLRGGIGPDANREIVAVNFDVYHKWGLSPISGIVKGNYKYFKGPSSYKKLYDLKNDPDEKKNIAPANQKAVEELNDKLDSLLKARSTAKSYGESYLPVTKPGDKLPSAESVLSTLEMFGEAASLKKAGDNEGAFKLLTAALKINPKNKLIATALAIISEFTSPLEEQIVLWRKAALLNPGDGMVITSLAMALSESGDKIAAMVELNRVFETEQENPAARMLASDILYENAKGMVGMARKEALQKALGHLVTALRSSREDAGLYFKFGSIAAELAEITESLPPSENSEEKNEAIREILAFRRAARKALESTIEVDPTMADAYLALGKLMFTGGQNGVARTNLEKYLELAPDGAGAKEAGKLLESIKASEK